MKGLPLLTHLVRDWSKKTMLAINSYKWQCASFLLIEKCEKLLQTSSSYCYTNTLEITDIVKGSFFFSKQFRNWKM